VEVFTGQPLAIWRHVLRDLLGGSLAGVTAKPVDIERSLQVVVFVLENSSQPVSSGDGIFHTLKICRGQPDPAKPPGWIAQARN